jgi:hypothetical protein
MKDGAVRLREIALAGDTLQLAPGLAARVTMRADVTMSDPAMRDAIVVRTAMLSRVNGAPTSSGEGEHRRGGPGALGGASAPCSRAAQSGLWSNPGKGLGSLERLRRGLSS